ncbi:carboxylesterase family protein [Planctomonas sp. JC2975]|uniref:carboxylesterase/lipase family protein n=1 Tax=Planctomonas sp. JC2975 TaxID=2729626 RepID=UPI0014758BDA|nr:carboxylesterase family protein [Planctomonas sp. JC2975]NNC10298.1 carboxylesterase family protein [Planctomonas sp. JC2975]
MNHIGYPQAPPTQSTAAIVRAVSMPGARRRIALVLAVLAAVIAALAVAGPASAHAAGATSAPLTVTTDAGALHGVGTGGVREFRGVPYAAPPTGDLRWQAPQPVAHWWGVRDASTYSPVCPQAPASPNGSSEDCLYLNVTAPATTSGAPLPVIVWIHGGGFEFGEGADYNADKLASTGAVVVTINYRLGLLGFLAHPALADHGTAGNYGLMDQQAALRWVQTNIAAFGGNAHDVTIAGQSAGGLSVLQQLVSPGATGLFQRAVVESGAFAPKQKSLAQAEAEGTATATALGCSDQSADCLRSVPVDELVAHQPLSITPGVVDGAVVKQSVGTAIATGDFNRVPIINGSNTSEERIFTEIGVSVQKGATVPLSGPSPVTASNYVSTISSSFGVSTSVANRIAAQYPLSAYATPNHAYSAAASDANFACTAYALDSVASLWTPTYGYEFNDANAPWRDLPDSLGAPSAATHDSELQYLFDLANALPGTLSADQEQLATTMRGAWSQFAATGSPATATQQWPKFGILQHRVLSLVAPAPRLETDFASTHHCGFWAGVALTTGW